MLWVQDPNQSNVYNLNRVVRYANSYFKNKKKEYLEAKIEEIETNSTIKISETYIWASLTLRMITNLELIQQRMRMVI